jgi:hypothetical protein
MKHSLVPVYREMHAIKPFTGRSIYRQVERIAALVRSTGAQTLLDYGCGGGRQYHEGRCHLAWGAEEPPTLYDPAVAGIDQRPEGPFDGVICTDVLEHIPEDELIETLEDIRSLARMWAFFSICCLPAKKTFPGTETNVHVTIRPPEWWRELVGGIFVGAPEAHLSFVKTKKKPYEKPSTMRKDPARYEYHKQRRAKKR